MDGIYINRDLDLNIINIEKIYFFTIFDLFLKVFIILKIDLIIKEFFSTTVDFIKIRIC